MNFKQKKYIMTLKTLTFLIPLLFLISSCKSDDPVTPPPSGEVLLAEVTGDSVGTSGGSSTRASSISSQTLNFIDRDYMRITMIYSGNNNQSNSKFTISYLQDTNEVVVYNGNNLNYTTTETILDTTFISPRVNSNFIYRINTFSPGGTSYLKFRDLKIYKK